MTGGGNATAGHGREENMMATDSVSRNHDAAFAQELIAHHAVMVADLDRLTAALANVAAAGSDIDAPHCALRDWVNNVLVPHVGEEEEETTYRAAAELTEDGLLIRSMLVAADGVSLVKVMGAAHSHAQHEHAHWEHTREH
jgi:hypothetical protein